MKSKRAPKSADKRYYKKTLTTTKAVNRRSANQYGSTRF